MQQLHISTETELPISVPDPVVENGMDRNTRANPKFLKQWKGKSSQIRCKLSLSCDAERTHLKLAIYRS